MDRVVGIGEYIISNNKDDIIKTFALSSCIAVTVYSQSKLAAGMIHIALPNPSSLNKNYSLNLCHYASTGIPFLIDRMCSRFGCLKGELEVKIFGGADSIKGNDMFNIGRKNIYAVKTSLDILDIKYQEAQIGGKHSRTLFMEVASGDITVMMQPLII